MTLPDKNNGAHRWLITGGCGFIGANLTASLAAKGHYVRVFDNLTTGSKEHLDGRCAFSQLSLERLNGKLPTHENEVELVVADILDREAIESACAGVDIVVHLAANTGVTPSVIDPMADCNTNIVGTLNCLEAARKAHVKRFIFASSGAPVGEAAPPVSEETLPRPVSPYGASKLAGEAYCSAYYRTYGLETVALRFSNVYGPGSWRKGSVVAKFIRQAFAARPIIVNGDGEQTRDFIYIDDLINALISAAHKDDVAGEVFQIASGTETSVNNLVALLNPRFRAAGVAETTVTHTEALPGEIRRTFADIGKAKRILGFRPAISLAEGLDRTVDWFLSASPPSSRPAPKVTTADFPNESTQT